MAVTWNPDNNSGMILSNGNLTASSPNTGEDASVYVEATQPIQPGDKVFFQIDVSGGNGAQPGYAGGAGTAFSAGFAWADPNAANPNNTALGDPAYGYPLGNTLTTSAPSVASTIGSGYDGGYGVGGSLVKEVHRGVSEWGDPSYVDYALDRTTDEFWVYSSTTGQWNNSSTANPATDSGGWDASALGDHTVYAIVRSQKVGNESATLINNDADVQGSVPAGFTTLQDLGNSGSSTSTTSPPPVTAPASPSPVTIGSGSDSLVLQISEDAWNGNAQFTVSVDGRQIGGTQTATASHAAGQEQAFTVEGAFGAGNHQVTVNFLNDAWGGTSSTDRNLYVDSSTIDGSAIAGGSLALYNGGPQSFSFEGLGSSSGSSPPPITAGSGSSSTGTVGSGSNSPTVSSLYRYWVSIGSNFYHHS